jgi:hypothetical protein
MPLLRPITTTQPGIFASASAISTRRSISGIWSDGVAASELTRAAGERGTALAGVVESTIPAGGASASGRGGGSGPLPLPLPLPAQAAAQSTMAKVRSRPRRGPAAPGERLRPAAGSLGGTPGAKASSALGRPRTQPPPALLDEPRTFRVTPHYTTSGLTSSPAALKRWVFRRPAWRRGAEIPRAPPVGARCFGELRLRRRCAVRCDQSAVAGCYRAEWRLSRPTRCGPAVVVLRRLLFAAGLPARSPASGTCGARCSSDELEHAVSSATGCQPGHGLVTHTWARRRSAR